MFKVGDWVRDLVSGKVFMLEEVDFVKPYIYYLNNCEIWQPKEKEWVVCIVSSIKNMFAVFQYEEDSYNDIKDMNPGDIVTIQPFIGQLPSDLKENR